MKKILFCYSLAIIAVFLSLPCLADSTNSLTGTYYGTAIITSPANLGTVDLAFYLDVTGTAIQHDTSYVVLEKTLLFPSVPPKIPPVDTGKEVGPRVNGAVSLNSFNLAVDRFENTVADKTVYRDIVLSNASIWSGGASIGGDYTETITGLDRNPIVLQGRFVLVQPKAGASTTALQDLDNNGCIDLDEIKAGGSDSTVVEYDGISAVLHLYYNPTVTPNICAPQEQIVNDALTNYYNSLK